MGIMILSSQTSVLLQAAGVCKGGAPDSCYAGAPVHAFALITTLSRLLLPTLHEEQTVGVNAHNAGF